MVIAQKKVEEEKEKIEVKNDEEEKTTENEEKLNESMEENENDFVNDLVLILNNNIK